MTNKSKPSHYPALPFHAIRAISFVSNVIVTGIFIFFCYQLKTDGFKLPWTILVALAASLINLIVLAITSAVHCCFRLSPIFNLILNIPILLLWILAFGLLAYNLYGTWAHTCTLTNWGSNDGVTVCQLFKAMFSFVIFAILSQIAHIVLDVRARISQTRSGKYEKMRDSTTSLKLEPYKGAEAMNPMDPHPTTYDPRPSFDAAPGWRPGQKYQDSTSISSGYQSHSTAPSSHYNTPAASSYSVPTQSSYPGQHIYSSHASHDYPATNYYSGS